MNDPIEDQLRQLRPARIPQRLQARLAEPPVGSGKVVRFPIWKIAAALAAAACVALAVLIRDAAPRPEAPQLVVTEVPSGEVIAERTVAVVDDGGQRAWEIVETERIEGQTLAADAGGLVAFIQHIRHDRTPREIHFD